MSTNQTNSKITALLHSETAPGILLMLVALVAVIFENTSLQSTYEHLRHASLTLPLGIFSLEKSFEHWVNDGLMVLFFLLVGLEIKKEVVQGQLSSAAKLALPGFAALGGMIFPALFYFAVNHTDPSALRGWAIPAATDIAFALGVLALVGKGLPPSLKIFLTALAVLDDLGAILIIALFYTSDLSVASLGMAVVFTLILFIFNRKGVVSLWPYLLIGFCLWVCVLKSGVHATLAGVVIAFMIPLSLPKAPEKSPLNTLMHTLHPWVNFLILPIFGFINAGVSLQGLSFSALGEGIPLGIILGLFFGKQLGIFGFCFLMVKAKIAALPEGSSWAQVYAIAVIAGIGFTMSLFIGSLAFGSSEHLMSATRIGVLTASLLSGITGAVLIKILAARR